MRTAPNPYVGKNYIPDNPRMATPPAFWLQRLWDLDNMLVVMPSRHVPFAYVLARRRQLTAGLTDAAFDASIDQPDTKMCADYGCLQVCMLYRTPGTHGWSIDNIIRELKARDTWQGKGVDAYVDRADAADAAREKGIKASIRDDMWHRSGDAWRSYQARTGQRNQR